MSSTRGMGEIIQLHEKIKYQWILSPHFIICTTVIISFFSNSDMDRTYCVLIKSSDDQ